jgi:Polyketide cyclase / dehydrase and lipid transport
MRRGAADGASKQVVKAAPLELPAGFCEDHDVAPRERLPFQEGHMHARTLFCAIVAIGAPAGSAIALEVSHSAQVSGALDAVWRKVGEFCAIQEWHPAVSRCEQTEEGGTTYRTLTLADGGTIRERLIEKTDSSYTYEIIESPLPVQNYRSTFGVSADGEATRVDWKGAFDAKDASDADAEAVISGIYQAGLDGIAKPGGN